MAGHFRGEELQIKGGYPSHRLVAAQSREDAGAGPQPFARLKQTICTDGEGVYLWQEYKQVLDADGE
jgi:hypothetical protein